MNSDFQKLYSNIKVCLTVCAEEIKVFDGLVSGPDLFNDLDPTVRLLSAKNQSCSALSYLTAELNFLVEAKTVPAPSPLLPLSRSRTHGCGKESVKCWLQDSV